MKSRITKQSADASAAAAKRYTIWDSELAGFGLRVEPTGARSFVAKYRAQGGGRGAPQRLVVLGRYPTITVGQARAAAVKVLAASKLGGDPALELAKRRRELTVYQLIDLYEECGLVIQRGVNIGRPMKPLTARYTVARLRNHVVPLLGQRRASELNEGDIERLARDIALGKTAVDEKRGPRSRVIVSGGEGAARKVTRDLSAVLAFGMRQGVVSRNVVATASVRKTDNQRDRFLSLEEIRALGAALTSLESEGSNRKAIDIARLWVLSGCRRNEIMGLRWSEVDFEFGVLRFEDSKTGRGVRPIGTPALALLSELRDRTAPGSEYVFPAERGDGFYQGAKGVWAQAISRAKLPGVSPHVLRHTLGGTAASSGEALLMVGAILGHRNPRSTAIYAHVALQPAKSAADRATADLSQALLWNS